MDQNIGETFKKLLLEGYFEFKTRLHVFCQRHISVWRTEHTLRHVACSCDICGQGKGIPLATPTFLFTKSCYFARNSDACHQ
jgi:hypothetical protein